MAKAKVGTAQWYEENKTLFIDDKGQRYYDLPLASIMEVVHEKEKETGCTYSWKTNIVMMEGPWVVVEVIVLKDGVEEGSWLGSTANILTPSVGDVSPVTTAQSRAMKGYFKRKFAECNLPVELSIVDQEQTVAPTPEEMNLPVKEVGTKEKATKKPAKKKEADEEKPVEVEETQKEKAEKVEKTKKEETKKEEPKTASNLDEALKFVVNVGSLPYDGKTIEEVAKMPGADVFLKHFASRVNHEKYAIYKDFCEAAKIVVDAKGL